VGAFSHKFSVTPSGETTDRIKKNRGRENGTDLLCHCAKYDGDCGSRAGCRRQSVIYIFVTGRSAQSAAIPAGLHEAQPCRYCIYSVVQKWAFPQSGPLPRAKFHVYRGRNTANAAPKTIKFSQILIINLPLGPTRLPNFYEILRFQLFNLVTFGDNQLSYKHFPAVGAFSHKFSIAPVAKLLLRSSEQ